MHTNKPLIFLGSNSVMEVLTETCAENKIPVAGVIDNDYFGNQDCVSGVPVIDTELSFSDPEKLKYYCENFVFFCAVNWQPLDDTVNQRNCNKRQRFIDLVEQHGLPCINIIDCRAKVSPSANLGQGIYIGDFTTIDPRVQLDNFATIYGQCHIGHDTKIGKNTVIQRRCVIAGELTIESDVFVSSCVCILKNHSTIGQGTFIHECVYLRRGTVPGEIVSMHGANMKRVVPYPIVV